MNSNKLSKDQQKLSIHDLPDLLTIQEVANILRVSTLTIKRWGKSDRLVPIRLNKRGDRRYRKEQILELLGMNRLGDQENSAS